MNRITDRRTAMQVLGVALAAGAATFASTMAGATLVSGDDDIPTGAAALADLTKRLSKAPRRRDFKTVPMILNNADQWDHEALSEVLAYKPVAKQAWDNTDIAGPWLNVMRNALNAQIWSFGNPDFLESI